METTMQSLKNSWPVVKVSLKSVGLISVMCLALVGAMQVRPVAIDLASAALREANRWYLGSINLGVNKKKELEGAENLKTVSELQAALVVVLQENQYLIADLETVRMAMENYQRNFSVSPSVKENN